MSKSTALVFPGQGSQHPGMGKLFYENFKEAKMTFEEASDILKIDFKHLCFEGSESELQLTSNTQPCLLLVSTAMWRSLHNLFSNITNIAGHSLGEYSALVAASALLFSEALDAVRKRGEFMQLAVPQGQGAMAAVLGLENSEVEKLCLWATKKSGKVVEPANYNAPGQVVISGEKAGIDWLKENLNPNEVGISRTPKLIPLKVSAPFHCSLMKPAEEKMASVILNMKISNPQFTIIQNKTAREPKDIKELTQNLISQITSSVKWAQSVTYLKEKGVTHIIEMGPGTVLTSLVKKIDSSALKTFNIQSLDDLRNLEKELN